MKKKKYVVYTDTHLKSMYSIPVAIEYDVIFLGDIVDVSGCHRKDLMEAQILVSDLQSELGPRYVLGNHEADPHQIQSYFRDGETIFTHGTHLYWDQDKIRKWYSKRPGKGRVGMIMAAAFNWLRQFKQPKLSDEQAVRVFDFALKHQCTTVVTGHRHSKKIMEKRIKIHDHEVTLITLPRGRSEFYV